MQQAKSTKCVLVVEDELDMRFFLKTFLEKNGLHPVTVGDGLEGLEKAREIKPDAILLDVMTPREGGAVMYVNLKTDPDLRDIPVIMLSAVAKETFYHYLHMINTEFADSAPMPEAYIEKPPEPAYLLKILKKFI